MTRKDIIAYYGSQAEAARRLGCQPQTIIEWELTGVPEGRQYQVELATRGKLRASKPADRGKLRASKPADRGKLRASKPADRKNKNTEILRGKPA